MLRSIRVKLIFLVISLAIIPLITVGVALSTRIITDQREQGLLLQTQTAIYVGGEFNGFIRQMESQLILLSRLKNLLELNEEEQKNALLELLSYQNKFEEIILTNDEGFETAHVHQYEIFLEEDLVSQKEYPEFLFPIVEKQVYFGPVSFHPETGEPLMNISVPIIDLRSNKVKGVLIGSARLKKIWQLLAEMKVQESERIYILDSNHRVIAHPNPSVVLRNTIFNIDLSNDSLVRKGLFNTDVILSYKSITFGNQLFRVVVEQDVNQMFKLAFNSIGIIMMLIIISLLMAIGLIYIIIRTIIRPVRELSLVANEIEQGNLSKKAIIYRDDEVGALSHAFNRMTYRLQNSLKQLKIQIEEKTQSELEIKKLQELLSNIFDSMPSVLIGVDSNIKVTHWNKETASITHLSKSIAIGRFLYEAFPELKGSIYKIENSMNTKLILKEEKVKLNFDNKQLFMNITIYPLLSNNKVDGAVIRLDDVTELLRQEEKMRQAQKMESIGTLAGGLAHDFNNILQPIFGYSDMLNRRVANDTKSEMYIEQIIKASVRASELVQHILTFSRQSEIELSSIKLQDIIKEVSLLLRASLPATIEINHEIDDNCGFVMANVTQLNQVILNLGTNAYHAMQEKGGELKIKLEVVDIQSKEFACLTISDTGIGMNSEVLERIFDPYFTTKEKGKGTGLGLSVVKGIIDAHNGSISVSSTPNIGSTFTIYLPLTEQQKTAEPVKSEKRDLKGTERILIVDDDPSIVKIEKEMLEHLGYRIVAVTNSEEAMNIFAKDIDGFDMVITDLTKPKITGDVLAVHLLKLKPDLPVIMCTGISEMIDEKKAMDFGIKALLRKPMTYNTLAGAIRNVFDNSDLDKDNR